WLTRQAEAWHRRMETVLDRLSQVQTDEGMFARARETADRWVALSPLQERAHRRRIQLALAAGDRAAALRAYQSCADILQRELGVVPAPETEALVQRTRALSVTAVVEEVSARFDERAQISLHLPLVGRADEIAQLMRLYHEARTGCTRAALVLG